MTPDRWTRIESVFDEVADLPAAERPAFLDVACRTDAGAPDPALREEVERLLALDAGADSFFDGFAEGGVYKCPEPPTAGPWRLAEQVGQGGMGEVWRADRIGADVEGFHQTAAVKLVRPGLGDDLVWRFRAERRILAGLEHPAIARLLGGGTASDGRPYLATEFVDGEPITAYADRRRLGVNERLGLFLEVCGAVAYAHARLVVHRDLKPSNVLVTDDGRPKLLDFGVAKLLDAADDGLRTRTGRQLLTPAYAAPEQTAGGPVTTATDVYGLGVLLYEVLTGRRPAPGVGLTRPSAAVTEAAPTGGRVPPDPARLGAEAEEAGPGRTGALRSTTADRLRRRLRGDLDRIVMKALQPDPEQRYRGAAELAADLRRHLDGLPVEARAPTLGYRLGRFVRRHRAGVMASVLALLAVVGGAGVALWQAAEADRARERSDKRAQEAEAVAVFLEDVFAAGNPERASGPEAVAAIATILDEAQRRADAFGDDTPEARLAVERALARAYWSAGRPADQRRVLEATLPRHLAVYGPESERTAEVLWMLGNRYRREGRVEDARDHFARAEAAAISASSIAPSPTLPRALVGLARTLPDSSTAEREALLRRARIAARQLPEPDLEEATVVDLFAQGWPGDPARAEALFREAATLARRGGDRRLEGDVLNNLGLKLEFVRPDEAVALLRQAVRVLSDTLGADHPHTVTAVYNLGAVLVDGGGAPAEGIPHLRRALAAEQRVHPEGNSGEVKVLYWLGRAYLATGALRDAEEALARSIALGRAFQGEGSWRVRQARPYYAEALARQGRTAEAARIYREEIARVRSEAGDPSALEAGLASLGGAR